MNLYLNLLLISAHKNSSLELLVKGEFPTLIYLHFIFQTHSSLAQQNASGKFKSHFSSSAFSVTFLMIYWNILGGHREEVGEVVK